jgi:peptide/nickel transport system permease protein
LIREYVQVEAMEATMDSNRQQEDQEQTRQERQEWQVPSFSGNEADVNAGANADAEGGAAPAPIQADHVDALPGLTAPVPNDVQGRADQPVEDIQINLMGQFVPTPVVVPAVVPVGSSRRPRFALVRTLLGSPKSRLGAAIVLFFILIALLAPVIAPGDPSAFVGRANQPPSTQRLLGTDAQGKDVFNQTVWGARSSLIIGFGTALVTTLIAAVMGMTAGYFRGRVDDVLTFVMNLFLVIPGLVLLVVLAGYLQPGTTTVIIALSATGWAFGARVARSQALSLREKDFVSAAIVSGQSHWGIIFRQVFPNMINIVVGTAVGALIYGITASTALAFLGLTNVSDVSWGTNLYWAQNGSAMLRGTWWTFLPSGLCVAIVAFGLALINYGMDEVTNPRLRAERELRNVIHNRKLQRVRATPVVPRTH